MDKREKAVMLAEEAIKFLRHHLWEITVSKHPDVPEHLKCEMREKIKDLDEVIDDELLRRD